MIEQQNHALSKFFSTPDLLRVIFNDGNGVDFSEEEAVLAHTVFHSIIRKLPEKTQRVGLRETEQMVWEANLKARQEKPILTKAQITAEALRGFRIELPYPEQIRKLR